MSRTPETLTAAQRAASLNVSETMSNDKDKARNAARDALLAHETENATSHLDVHSDVDGSVSYLSITDIEPYKHNPRTTPNPRYLEIKESIRVDGITNMLSVTRAPGAEKYTPYGGGNTRLQIARELFEEGDNRFARLMVRVKNWPGEAAVISAHLSENENRGDISFWEKALGVAHFKHEIESQDGVQLTASELNKELKQRGLNYGIKMIQNFAFAAEHLKAIGPWLRTEELNTIIRPTLGSYLDLANKLDASDRMLKEVGGVLEMHGSDLRATEQANEDLDPAERKALALDLESLLIDLKAVAAHAIGVEEDRLVDMAQALAQTPRISIKELQELKTQPKKPAVSKIVEGVQKQLGGMLGAVPAKGSSSTPVEPGENHQASAEEKLATRISAALDSLNALVPIWDFLKPQPDLPMGFWVDLPEFKESIAGEVLPEPIPEMRQRLWVYLALESGQFNAAITHKLQPDAYSLWQQAVQEGTESFAQACMDRIGANVLAGQLYISSIEHHELFSHPQLSPVVIELNAALLTYRELFPQRFQEPFKPLFEV